jgi:hypothetical protein
MVVGAVATRMNNLWREARVEFVVKDSARRNGEVAWWSADWLKHLPTRNKSVRREVRSRGRRLCLQGDIGDMFVVWFYMRPAATRKFAERILSMMGM